MSARPTSARPPRRRIQPFEVLTAGVVLLGLWAMLGPGDWAGGLLSPAGPDSETVAKGERRAALVATHQRVSFTLLSGFVYGDLPRMLGRGEPMTGPPRPRDRAFPAAVLALDDKDVAIDGFMLPLDADDTGVGQFILNANRDMCYFGAPTRVNEFVVVTMRHHRRTVLTHLPIVVFGRMSVGEERRGDRLSSVYRLDAEAIAAGSLFAM
jgi:hypothetical protein